MNESLPYFEFSHVTKSFFSGEKKLTILHELNFQIDKGESIAITGPSGSGKSTLLNLMGGLDRITSGKLLLETQEIQDWSEEKWARWRREKMGFIFQDFRLVPSFTAIENVTLPLEILGWDTHKARKRGEELLCLLGLGERFDHFPQQLSGGEQQRVGIARAFSHHPEVILADEPTGNLDPETSKQVMDSLIQLNQEEKTTLIMVTHDLENAEKMGRYVKMKNGKIEGVH